MKIGNRKYVSGEMIAEEKKDKLRDYEKYVIKYLKNYSNIKILEIGFGEGRLLSVLSKKESCSCLGIDNSEEHINKAKRLGFNVKKHDIEKGLDFIKDETYDFIIINHVLEHLINPLKLLKETYRILKEGGKVFISVPNVHYMVRLFNTSIAVEEAKSKHINCYDRTQLVNLLHYRCGFIIEEFSFNYQMYIHMKGLGKILDKILPIKRFSKYMNVIAKKG